MNWRRGMGARVRRTLDASCGRPWGNSGRFTVELQAVTDQAPRSSAVGEIFFNHTGRMAHKWVHYLEAYSEQFEHLRSGFRDVDGTIRPLRFLEIGVSHGGSLEMWRSFFGQEAVIFGVDLNPACRAFDGEAGQVRIGSQADPRFLASVVSEMGGVDVVLDDGSHLARHQRASIEALYPLVSPGGLYVVEDVHSAYWGNFGGGYRRRGTFIEFVKDLIDDMHSPYHGRSARQPALMDAVASITVIDSLAFIQKGMRRPPLNVRVGTPSW